MQFENLGKHKVDLEYINSLFVAEERRLMGEIDDANLKLGVNDAKLGLPPQKEWCQPYMLGFRMLVATRTAVATMEIA